MSEAGFDTVLQQDLDSFANNCQFKNELKGSTVLVTGATGLVGSQMVKSLACLNRTAGTGISIVAHVRSEEKAAAVFGTLLEREDISLLVCDVSRLSETDIKFDYIFHTASVTSSKIFVTKPVETLDTSIDGTRAALELAKKCGAKSMVYLSSMEAYGVTDPSLELITEKDLGYIDVLSVRSSYSEGKRICECLCASYASEYGVPVKIARLAQTFGAGVSFEDTRAFAQFAKSSLAGTDIVLHTFGNSMGNYCYTADAIKGLVTILFNGVNGEAYTVANESTAMKIKEVAQLTAEVLSNGKTKVVFDVPEDALKYGYAPDVTMHLTSEKLRKLGWKPEVDLPEMFRRLAESWKAGGAL